VSIHVCKCCHKGFDEFHLRCPGMTEKAALDIADSINGGFDLLTADQKQLGSFYGVGTKSALIAAMEGHIQRLQERVSSHIEIAEWRGAESVREG